MSDVRNAMVKVGAEMKEFTSPFIAQVFEVKSAERGRFLGSGTFIQLGTYPYLLTAAHVPNEAEKRSWAHSLGNATPPAHIEHPWQCCGFPSDLALVRLEDAHFSGLHRVRPIESRFLAKEFDELGNDFLFIHGWPDERSKEVWSLANGIVSKTLPYTTVAGTTGRAWFDDEIHFAIQYNVNDQRDEHGNLAQMPGAYGLSGATVWKTNWADHQDDWTPEKARVIGVAFDWDTDGGNLTCTRIEAVRAFINDSLRREAAYFRWEERGSPNDDDWDNWFSARPFQL